MIPKAFDEIVAGDLAALIDNEVAESVTIEYKAALPGSSTEEKREFLKDVSAFANTEGGDLLYGIKEGDGVPVALVGIGAVIQDDVRLRLENLLRDGLQPRLADVQMRFVSVPDGIILIIRVAASWGRPHRVIIGGHGHFYARGSAGSYQMDVEQLRGAYLQSQAVEDRIRKFQRKRISKLRDTYTPVPIISGAAYVVHVLPLSAFTSKAVISSDDFLGTLGAFSFFDKTGNYQRPNLDGVVSYQLRDGRNHGYTQKYRNGCLEAVFVCESVEREGVPEYFPFPIVWIEGQTIKGIDVYSDILRRLGVVPPLYVFISLLQAQGYVLSTSRFLAGGQDGLDRNVVLLPEAVIDKPDVSTGAALKPTFDILWQAFGLRHGTLNLDADGKWIGPTI